MSGVAGLEEVELGGVGRLVLPGDGVLALRFGLDADGVVGAGVLGAGLGGIGLSPALGDGGVVGGLVVLGCG